MLGELQREITEEESKQVTPSTPQQQQTKKDEAEPLLITEE